jgi:GxxExxY protein
MEREGRDGRDGARRRTVEFDELSYRVMGAALRVHSALGPGLLESAYEACLAHELEKAGLRVARQVPLQVLYDGVVLDCAYRMDIVVEGCLIIEIKAVTAIQSVHRAQLLSYLRLSGMKVGLLVNFHAERLANGGFGRVVNSYPS